MCVEWDIEFLYANGQCTTLVEDNLQVDDLSTVSATLSKLCCSFLANYQNPHSSSPLMLSCVVSASSSKITFS